MATPQDTIDGVEILDPTIRDVEVLNPAPRLPSLNGKTIGFLDNTKEKADVFLEQIAEGLRQRYNGVSVMHRRKLSYSVSATPAIIAEMAATCDCVITAMGAWGSCISCSVHDAIRVELQGVPSVAVCTADFLPGGRMQAAAMRMPDFPIVTVPQQYITHTPEAVQALADGCVEDILKYLIGEG